MFFTEVFVGSLEGFISQILVLIKTKARQKQDKSSKTKILFPLKNIWYVFRRQIFTQLCMQMHGMSPTQPKST